MPLTSKDRSRILADLSPDLHVVPEEEPNFGRKRPETNITNYSVFSLVFRGPFRFSEPRAPLPGLAAGTCFVFCGGCLFVLSAWGGYSLYFPVSTILRLSDAIDLQGQVSHLERF
jgi:hypothetical protein